MDIKEMDEIFEIERDIQKLSCSIVYDYPDEAIKEAKTIIDMLGDDIRIVPADIRGMERFKNCKRGSPGMGKENAKKYLQEFYGKEFHENLGNDDFRYNDYDRSLEISDGEDEARIMELKRWTDALFGIPECYALTLLNMTEEAEKIEKEAE
jgi:hypothetical protein